jgi:hypothetical protein
MDPLTGDDRSATDLLDSMDQVLDGAVASGQSRRALMARAAGLLAAGTALSVPEIAGAATSPSSRSVVSVLTTFETFGVTLLTQAVKRAPGTPSAQFAGVVMAANTAEFDHLQALKKLGGKALTQRFWIPDAVLDGAAGLFNAVAMQEEVEISTYLQGVTLATAQRRAREARLFAEALGTEAEHRVLARFARAAILGTIATDVPNNRGFEAFKQRTPRSALAATAKLGIGFGKQGAAPGAFYEFPGDPQKTGTGAPVLTPRPA